MVVLDTNTILRLFLRDDEEKASSVQVALKRENCLIPAEVIAEVVYVLLKTYKVERAAIQQQLLELLLEENVETSNQAVVEVALDYFGETKLDFVDCLMIGYAVIEGYQIFTFDKDLKKHLPQSINKP